MTGPEFLKLLSELETGADIALPLLGEAEYVPVVTAAAALAGKVASIVQARSAAQGNVVAAAMAAGDAAAAMAAAVKFGGKS